MANFTFTIESNEEAEISGLMVRLFGHAKGPAPAIHVAIPDEAKTQPDQQVDEVKRRKRRTKAEIEADEAKARGEETSEETVDEVHARFIARTDSDEEEDEDDTPEDVTLDMIKAVGSKAMGAIKASGVSAIFKQHGGGAETFGSLDPSCYAAVYKALVDAVK